jgi:hypothetical protein
MKWEISIVNQMRSSLTNTDWQWFSFLGFPFETCEWREECFPLHDVTDECFLSSRWLLSDSYETLTSKERGMTLIKKHDTSLCNSEAIVSSFILVSRGWETWITSRFVGEWGSLAYYVFCWRIKKYGLKLTPLFGQRKKESSVGTRPGSGMNVACILEKEEIAWREWEYFSGHKTLVRKKQEESLTSLSFDEFDGNRDSNEWTTMMNSSCCCSPDGVRMDREFCRMFDHTMNESELGNVWRGRLFSVLILGGKQRDWHEGTEDPLSVESRAGKQESVRVRLRNNDEERDKDIKTSHSRSMRTVLLSGFVSRHFPFQF